MAAVAGQKSARGNGHQRAFVDPASARSLILYVGSVETLDLARLLDSMIRWTLESAAADAAADEMGSHSSVYVVAQAGRKEERESMMVEESELL